MADEDDDLDQDDLAAEWGAALEESGDADNMDGDVAAEWEAMIGGGGGEDGGGPSGADRVLNQEEIDNLLGFDPDDGLVTETRGIRSLINSCRCWKSSSTGWFG